jgi:hypothetical protein
MAAMPAPRPGWQTVNLKAVAAWLVATALGIGVSSLGVRAVLDAAVPDRFLVLPAAEEPPPATRPTTRPATPSPSATGSRATRPAPTSPSSALPSRADPAASTSAQPPVDGWTSLGDGQYLRSFHLIGGDAVVRAGQGDVRLVSATPRPGYTMTILPSGPDRVVVNFATALHVSTLTASWGAAGPTAETTELP